MDKKAIKIMNLKRNEESKSADLILYGDIGEDYWEDISSREVIGELESLDVENINIYINSNGGGTSTAIAIGNALKRHKAKTTAYVDGIAASAATIITSSCDVVKMPKNALFMIHNPWTIAMGEEKDFEKTADVLGKVKNSIIETYAAKTGQSKELLSELMSAESWLNAEEAKEYGFVDEIIGDTDIEKVENRVISNGIVFNMRNFKNFNCKNQKNEEEHMTKDEIKNKYPDIYNEIFNEGIEEGKSKERNRIKEIEDLGITSPIVDKAKFEEPKKANEIAMDLLKELKVNNSISNETENTKEKDYRVENPPIVNNVSAEKKEVTFLGADINNILMVMNGNNREVE